MATKGKRKARPLLQDVNEKAEAIRQAGKMYSLPDAADMPPVDRSKIIASATNRADGGEAWDGRVLQLGMMVLGHLPAWRRVEQQLEALLSDAQVINHPPAAEFVRVVLELARGALLADSAEEALAPLDGALPKSRPFFENSGRGEGPVKRLVREVLPQLEKALKRKATSLEVWHACKARRRSGIKFRSTPTWGAPLDATPANGEPASWARFQVVISEVRRQPKTA